MHPDHVAPCQVDNARISALGAPIHSGGMSATLSSPMTLPTAKFQRVGSGLAFACSLVLASFAAAQSDPVPTPASARPVDPKKAAAVTTTGDAAAGTKAEGEVISLSP